MAVKNGGYKRPKTNVKLVHSNNAFRIYKRKK